MKTPHELEAAAAALLAQLEGRTLTPRDRMAIPPQEMPVQEPAARRANMNEVALGYSAAQARLEALRCL